MQAIRQAGPTPDSLRILYQCSYCTHSTHPPPRLGDSFGRREHSMRVRPCMVELLNEEMHAEVGTYTRSPSWLTGHKFRRKLSSSSPQKVTIHRKALGGGGGRARHTRGPRTGAPKREGYWQVLPPVHFSAQPEPGLLRRYTFAFHGGDLLLFRYLSLFLSQLVGRS
jgi:hypothetical protein